MSTAARSSPPASSTSGELARWKQARAALLIPKKAANTELAYSRAWKAFCAWCREQGYEPLPASFDALSLYIACLLDGTLRVSTVRVKMAGIDDRHVAAGYASPLNPAIRGMLSNAARERRERPRAKRALTSDQAHRMTRVERGKPKDQRDRALLLVGFATGWRRSELGSLDLADVHFIAREGVILSLGASKTDQKGQGREVSIPYSADRAACPVGNLELWIEQRGRWPGPLFSPVWSTGEIGRSPAFPLGEKMYTVFAVAGFVSILARPHPTVRPHHLPHHQGSAETDWGGPTGLWRPLAALGDDNGRLSERRARKGNHEHHRTRRD